MNIIEEDIQMIAKALGREAKKLEGETLLISGGAGFLGSYIIATIDYLNKTTFRKPCKIISVDNYITGKRRKIFETIDTKNIKLVNADITKPLKVKEPVTYIIHAAGLASPFYYRKYPIETIESAIYGAKNLLELVKEKKVKSFLYFSSSEIYGNPDPDHIPTPETYSGNVSTIGPRACYDESKRLGETLCMTYHTLYKTPVKIVRPFNVYGPGMHSDDFRVVPTFISSALKRKPLPVYSTGKQTRTFCYISDAIVGFFKVLLSRDSGEVYNVGNDQNELTMLQLAKLVKKILGKNVIIEKKEYPKSYPKEETMRRCPDISKIESKLNFQPQIDLKEGLKRTILWYQEEKIV